MVSDTMKDGQNIIVDSKQKKLASKKETKFDQN